MAELPSQYQSFIALSRYSRWQPDLGRRESWGETVDRLIGFWKNRLPEVNESIWPALRTATFNLQVMPSMRTLMTAGPALERDEVSGYNCAYTECGGMGRTVLVDSEELRNAGLDGPLRVHVRDPIVFDCIMYILLCGTGVGFSVERQHIAELPKLNSRLARTIYAPAQFPGVPVRELSALDDASNCIRVTDSKYGWASALRILIVELYNGNYGVGWDLSQIRPAGAPLKTFGGRASGPEPLDELFKWTVQLFRNAKGTRLTSIECHDLVCKIASVIVVGGVRRSALISLSNLSDERMQMAKTGQWWMEDGQRALANNSACYTDRPEMGIFMREWATLYNSKSGERGIFNREAAKAKCRAIGRDPEHDMGTNPCLTGNTLVALPGHGLQRIRALAGQTHDVITQAGTISEAQFEQTSAAEPIYEVELSNGYILEATEYHNFVLASGQKRAVRDLRPGDALLVSDIEGQFGVEHAPDRAYIDAWMRADGTWHNDPARGRKLYLYEPKHQYLEALTQAGLSFRKDGHQGRYVAYQTGSPVLPKDSIPDYVLRGDAETVLAYIRGSLESDGTLSRVASGWVLQFASVERPFLQELQALLRLLGARGHIALLHEAGDRPLPNGKGGLQLYPCRACWRLTVSNPLSVIQHLYPHLVKRGPYAKIESITVVDIRPTSRVEPVFCAGEPTTNSFALPCVVSGNCSEIILRPNEFCNLSEVIIRPHDTLETLTRKVTLATIYGTLQSTLTNFVYLPPIWKQNCEEERLLGVSMSGWMDHPILSGAGDRTTFIRWMETLRNVAHAVNEVWAAELGIPKSAAITCVKPSGTVSQLADCASGLHPRYAQFYERRVLADKKDPLARAMVEQGYPYEQSVYNATNYVFAFPIAAPATSHLRDDRRAIEQLKHWLLVDRYWCDHKPSVTIYVREDEWMEVGAFVYENFDALSGISFFPHSDHVYDQAPYTEIDEDEYQRLLDKMPEAIDLSMVSQYESSDQTIGAQELACAGGACEIP